ncbi:hypothetical protein PLESTB_000523400 [Pleodorina starrii]|uniref:Uncharacterized protein n=1 Tax=Pleodorina starrii TaxID=330485 RepID=A0A9W6BGA7_9CHLO|nr:hypothetical protein PLESTB_000523400 [Pleodorina starrii]
MEGSTMRRPAAAAAAAARGSEDATGAAARRLKCTPWQHRKCRNFALEHGQEEVLYRQIMPETAMWVPG